MKRLAIWTVILEGFCLVGFVWIARTSLAPIGKTAFLLGACVIGTSMAWKAAGTLTPQGVGVYAALVALGTVIVFQGLGYGFSPGLSKDLDLLTIENGARAALLFGLSFAAPEASPGL